MSYVFTTLYSFMWEIGLDGLTKEVFAVIFGFWLRKREPVYVPYSVIHRITGATPPSISAAIKRLEDYQYIKADRHTGKKTLYIIKLPDEIMSEFNEQVRPQTETNMEDIKPCNCHPLNRLITTSKVPKDKKTTPTANYLKVRGAEEFGKSPLKTPATS